MTRTEIVETRLTFSAPLKARQPTRYFVIHHVGRIPASLRVQDIDAAMIHSWHQARGWSGIGYHYIIRPDGTIERGRPRQMQGAHDEGENSCTIGICVVGNFGALPPTPLQVDSLCALLADLCDIYGLRPEDQGTIAGHRDNEPLETPTECPGDELYALLPSIRSRVGGLCGY